MSGNHQPLILHMKTTARFIFSLTTALGLTTFTLISAFTAAGSAATTAFGLGLLAIYGLIELTIRSYAPRRVLAMRRPAFRVIAAEPATVRVRALVEYPAGATTARAA
jgi:hypothetical protein